MPISLNQRRLDSELRLQEAIRINKAAVEHARQTRQAILQRKQSSEEFGNEHLRVSLVQAEDRDLLQQFTQGQRALLAGSQYALEQDPFSCWQQLDRVQDCLQAQACGTAFYYLVRTQRQMVGHAALKISPHRKLRSAVLEWYLPSSMGQTAVFRQQTLQAMVDQAFYVHGLQRLQTHAYANDFATLQMLRDCGFVEHTQPRLPWTLPSAAHNLRFELYKPVSFEAV